MNVRSLQHQVLLILLIAVSCAFAWVLFPFYGAIFWGVVLSILLTPIQQRVVVAMRYRQNVATVMTMLLFFFSVLVPLALIATSLMKEAAIQYEKINTGQIDVGTYLQKVMTSLPDWIVILLAKFGLTDVSTMKLAFSGAVKQGSQAIATKAFSIGQFTVEFSISIGIMFYLLFFLLRDGHEIAEKVKRTIPLKLEHKLQLFGKFVTVIRATVKGNIVVATVQGTLGGMMFWFLDIQAALLWGLFMAVMSLVPAVGAGLIWGPVAFYFLVTGATWQGITLTLYGIFVIGLIDNILRPILVGKDTQMPDYVVLISTLGGISIFGINGFVIGPVIAAVFMATWDIFSMEKSSTD
jgi:predicted PurR-regulated permease PerM